jgi:excisionase family DNA binding protein
MGKKLTVKETAAVLGVSPITVRRRIKAGELKANLEVGPYGETYFIDENDLAEAMEIKEVIPVKRELDVTDIQQAFQNIFEPILKKIEEQEELIKQQNEKIDQLSRHLEERDQKLMHAIRTIQQRQEEERNKPLWKKIFGR